MKWITLIGDQEFDFESIKKISYLNAVPTTDYNELNNRLCYEINNEYVFKFFSYISEWKWYTYEYDRKCVLAAAGRHCAGPVVFCVRDAPVHYHHRDPVRGAVDEARGIRPVAVRP